MIIVQFPNSVPVIVNFDLTLDFVTLIGRPQYNGRFCWQASLLHLRPSFSRTRMITRTICVQDLSSGTLLPSFRSCQDIFLKELTHTEMNLTYAVYIFSSEQGIWIKPKFEGSNYYLQIQWPIYTTNFLGYKKWHVFLCGHFYMCI